MDETFGNRLKHAWNVFMNRDPTLYYRELGTVPIDQDLQEEMKDLLLLLYTIE